MFVECVSPSGEHIGVRVGGRWLAAAGFERNAVVASYSSVDRCCFLTVYENVELVVCVVCERVVRGLAPGRHSNGCGSMLDQF